MKACNSVVAVFFKFKLDLFYNNYETSYTYIGNLYQSCSLALYGGKPEYP